MQSSNQAQNSFFEQQSKNIGQFGDFCEMSPDITFSFDLNLNENFNVKDQLQHHEQDIKNQGHQGLKKRKGKKEKKNKEEGEIQRREIRKLRKQAITYFMNSSLAYLQDSLKQDGCYEDNKKFIQDLKRNKNRESMKKLLRQNGIIQYYLSRFFSNQNYAYQLWIGKIHDPIEKIYHKKKWNELKKYFAFKLEFNGFKKDRVIGLL